ncbi:MAG TPA: hypothetical protein VIX35_07415, partial [Vicinamibacterales bacterium]
RSNRLAAVGWTVVRATPAQLETSSEEVLTLLRCKLVHPRISSMNVLSWSTSPIREIENVERGAADVDRGGPH